MGYANSIAELTGRIGAAKARGVIGQANAWIPAIQNIPRSLGEWADAKENRKVQAQQAQLRDLQIAEAQRQGETSLRDWHDTEQIRALGPLVGNDPEALAREVGSINPERAAPYQAQATAAQAEMKRQANRFLVGVIGAPEDKKEEVWTRARTVLVGAFPKAAAMLPESYDPAFVTDLYNATATDAQFEEANKPKPATTPAQALALMKAEADLIPKPADQPKPGTLEAYFVTKGADTPAKQLRAKAEWDAAGRAPDKAGDEATLAQKATAERWIADQLNDLDARKRASEVGGYNRITGDAIVPMSQAEYETARRRILDTRGAQPTTTPGARPAPVAPVAPVAPAAAPTRTTSAATAAAAAQSLGMPLAEYVKQLAARGVIVQ